MMLEELLSDAQFTSTPRKDLSWCEAQPNHGLKPLRELRELIDATEQRPWHFESLDSHLRALEKALFSVDDLGFISALFISGVSARQLSLTQRAYSRWETELERRFVRSENLREIGEYTLAERFARLLHRETDMLRDIRPRRILFIGSGPLPISAIFLSEMLHASVDCVDSSAEAVELSRKFIQETGLEHKIQIFHQEGQRVNASGYDAVVIALLAKPKNEILKQIRATADPSCRVICRTSFGLRTLLYDPTDLSSAAKFYAMKDLRLAMEEGDIISSALLIRSDAEH